MAKILPIITGQLITSRRCAIDATTSYELSLLLFYASILQVINHLLLLHIELSDEKLLLLSYYTAYLLFIFFAYPALEASSHPAGS